LGDLQGPLLLERGVPAEWPLEAAGLGREETARGVVAGTQFL
jgi:hypothetical protein